MVRIDLRPGSHDFPAPAPIEITLTLGIDGRVYCNDLTPELLPVLAALCPTDVELQARQLAMQGRGQQ